MYYDEEEEAIQRQLKKKKFLDGLTDAQLEEEYHKEKVRASFQKKRDQVMTISKGGRSSIGEDGRSNIRVVLIIIVLCIICYFILR